MTPAKPRWDEHLDWPSQKLVARITEDAFSLKVHHVDPTRSINHHHGVGGRLHRPLEAFMASPELFLLILLVGQITDQRHETCEIS